MRFFTMEYEINEIKIDRIKKYIDYFDNKGKSDEEILSELINYIEATFFNLIKVTFFDEKKDGICEILIKNNNEVIKDNLGCDIYGIVDFIICEQQYDALLDILKTTKETLASSFNLIAFGICYINDYSNEQWTIYYAKNETSAKDLFRKDYIKDIIDIKTSDFTIYGE
ncbi:hypothetical protein Q361_11733 [Flavobacterium croceum DSM 17960]|uniref:Uncharacterized protein n=1 Tax=Flavobacterium croceum DSM 17960 TaxID=1121886 RepID=A0A2S4N5B1_9FLAO|nr:hypothetical protein [Flavobacterium croceum]POS00929.1 hypothetical protein Q361_11733 [Flavobacterium croceum DSM 17960]